MTPTKKQSSEFRGNTHASHPNASWIKSLHFFILNYIRMRHLMELDYEHLLEEP